MTGGGDLDTSIGHVPGPRWRRDSRGHLRSQPVDDRTGQPARRQIYKLTAGQFELWRQPWLYGEFMRSAAASLTTTTASAEVIVAPGQHQLQLINGEANGKARVRSGSVRMNGQPLASDCSFGRERPRAGHVHHPGRLERAGGRAGGIAWTTGGHSHRRSGEIGSGFMAWSRACVPYLSLLLTLLPVGALGRDRKEPETPGRGPEDRCASLNHRSAAGLARWRLYRGKEMELCIPADWVPFTDPDEEDGATTPPTAAVQAEVRLTGVLPARDSSYEDFDEWVRGRRLKGSALRVGTLGAFRVGTTDPRERVLRTYIAVPYPPSRVGGVVDLFVLGLLGKGGRAAVWTAAYDSMLSSLRLLHETASTW
jgi:hypothetical protein